MTNTAMKRTINDIQNSRNQYDIDDALQKADIDTISLFENDGFYTESDLESISGVSNPYGDNYADDQTFKNVDNAPSSDDLLFDLDGNPAKLNDLRPIAINAVENN